jgi:hypothetical protein
MAPDEPPTELPPPQGQLSEKTRTAATRILDALRQKGVRDPICPVCRNSQWSIGAYTPIFVTTNVNRPALGGPSYPLVALVCGVCGNTQLINLLTLGFKPEELDGLAFEELPGAT